MSTSLAHLENKSRKTHGLSKSPEYRAYMDMLQRCYSSNHRYYKDYGGRGVTVCDRWNPKKGGCFENFYADMGERPSGKHSLDKEAIDRNNKIYCPEMCRWATQKEQMRRVRNNTIITYKGDKKILSEVAEELNISCATLLKRIKLEWPETDWGKSIQSKTASRNSSRSWAVFKGEKRYIGEIAKELGIDKEILKDRIRRGWPEQDWGKEVKDKSGHLKVIYEGKEWLMIELSKELDIPYDSLYMRIRSGWPEEKWATKVKKQNGPVMVTYKGKEIRIAELAKELQIDRRVLRKRVSHGWPEDRWNEPIRKRIS